MKCRVILVDDEPAIAQGLGFLIQRFVPECEVIALAYDGQEGYERIVELEPDIVITDICMPEMDGIEMIQKLKDGGREYHFAILSGYEEFEYARSAIQLGVEEYITKPVEEEELRAVLGKVCDRIEKECSRRMDHEKIQSAVKEYMMRDYLEGKLSRPDLMRERLAEFGFPLSDSAYACAVLEVHSPEKSLPHGIAEQVRAFSQRYLEFCLKHTIVENSETMVTVIMAVPENTEPKKIRNRIGMVRLELAEASDDQVSAGISLLHYDGTEIRDAFTEAECALNYKLIKGLEAKEYIRKNFDQDISLNDISERFFINPSYFSQLFKKKTGKTYQNYLIEVRVARAKKLLEETDLKIYEICSLVGYSDANHFNRVFERVEGVKPSEYRRKQ